MSSVSPPHKKARTITETGNDTDIDMSAPVSVSDAPVNALFVPAPAGESSKPIPPTLKQGKKKARRMKRNPPEQYSPADVLFRDVRDFLGEEYVDGVLAKGDQTEWEAPAGLELWGMIELEVGAFTVSGMS
jgi:tRNA (uracil-5-)-methyltransferase